ncbi:hypothetical protein BD324DRAFT_627072 [Kockovaella imperatae]|uniref:AAA+ ATPase domain-containing protein n=1 Tax=Kockovaella imperatae TaxID=4999 RepID=A0A1Y1UFF6_9TREE|nr:hypothetical protein BD324DRAFT_627072 [Kockovaella imperatae]ORX36758.1 hypothetical protein BD324DRAFT_627072 [Kockovaella imperatae]
MKTKMMMMMDDEGSFTSSGLQSTDANPDSIAPTLLGQLSSTGKPIHSFFQSTSASTEANAAAGPSTGSANSGSGEKVKRKRKKVDDVAQGLISRSSSGWSIARRNEGTSTTTSDAETGGKDGGENSILEDGTRGASNGRGKGRARSRRKVGIGVRRRGQQTSDTGVIHRDSSYIGDGSPDPLQSPNPSVSTTPHQSPRKRKGAGAPRPTNKEIINLVSSDHHDIPQSSSHPSALSVSKIKAKALTRTLSANSTSSSKGAKGDPINVDELTVPSGPKKIVFAADQKAAHSFFHRRAAEAVGPPNGSTPIQETQASLSSKGRPVHGFFSNGLGAGGSVPGQLRDGWGHGVKIGGEWVAPLPGGQCPTHIGAAEFSSAGPSKRPTRAKSSIFEHPSEKNGFWLKKCSSILSSDTPHLELGVSSVSTKPSTPPFITLHPAIQSLFSRHINSREAWADQFAPLSASQVLGNETESTYLLEWLRALSVGTGSSASTRRRIFRKVSRTKALDGWIVDDAGLFGEPFGTEDELEAYEDFYEPPLVLDERPIGYPALDDRLAGCILLSGPNGAGKSAAVYAVARELGWEVFEVNPGMGKRTGAGLMSWIGDVGKNHLVQQSSKETVGSGCVEGQSKIWSMDNSPRKNHHGHRRTTSGEYRQSLILIEEADILFQEEQTFWPTIVSLVAGSRRPVILTCNDPSRIPIDTLPLQTVLYFQPPPSYLAIPFLETLAQQYGISPNRAVDLYHGCCVSSCGVVNHLDQPLPPNGSEPIKRFDLRRAINQLQFDRKVCRSSKRQPQDDLDEFRRIEVLSFCDAFVGPRGSHVLETELIDRHRPNTDDELGVHQLVKPWIKDSVPVLIGFDKATEIEAYLMDLVGGPPPPSDLEEQRAYYIRALLPFLDPLIPLSAPLLPRSSLFLETVPMIQAITAAEDILEQEEDLAAALGQSRVSKKTGRPRRSTGPGQGGYERWFELDVAALKAVRDSLWTS